MINLHIFNHYDVLELNTILHVMKYNNTKYTSLTYINSLNCWLAFLIKLSLSLSLSLS